MGLASCGRVPCLRNKNVFRRNWNAMAVESTARSSWRRSAPLFRSAPHNIEVEQALLGAILVNNEAFYRVSDFLEPQHFFEPIHQKIYELAGSLVRSRQGRDAGHAQDLSAGRPRRRRPQRPASTSPASPPRRPRSSMRRTTAAPSTISRCAASLIVIGEDMVNVAYDAPVDPAAARPDRRRRAPASTNSPRPAATTAASSASPRR